MHLRSVIVFLFIYCQFVYIFAWAATNYILALLIIYFRKYLCPKIEPYYITVKNIKYFVRAHLSPLSRLVYFYLFSHLILVNCWIVLWWIWLFCFPIRFNVACTIQTSYPDLVSLPSLCAPEKPMRVCLWTWLVQVTSFIFFRFLYSTCTELIVAKRIPVSLI